MSGPTEAELAAVDGDAAPPAAMRAFEIHSFGAPPRAATRPVPEPGPGEILVRMSASVVSHLDRTVAGGEFAVRPSLPYVPGTEGAGHVVRLGPDVERPLEPGQPVRVYGRGLGLRRPGTWSQYALVAERAVEAVPGSLDLAVAAACGSVALTAWAAVVARGSLERGERLGVTGALGAVGSLAVQLGLRHGAAMVSAWARRPERADSLPDGVTMLDAAEDGPEASVDLLVDTVGGPGLAQRLAAVRPGGRAVLVGYTAGEELHLSLPNFLAADVSLRPLSMIRQLLPDELLGGLLEDFAAGRLQIALDRVPVERLPEALSDLAEGRAGGRVVAEW